MSVEEENKAVVRRMSEGLSKRDLAAVDEHCAADCVFYFPGGVAIRGTEGMKRGLTMLLTAFPDLHTTLEDVIAEGDKVVWRETSTGTQEGRYAGVDPTGRKAIWMRVSIARLIEGKCVEMWSVFDRLDVMQQLGAVLSG